MKIVGILILSGAIIIYGFSLSLRVVKRIKTLESMVLFIDFTENQIRYLGNTIEKIIEEAIKSGRFNSLHFIKIVKGNTSYNEINNIVGSVSCLCDNDVEHIVAFFAELGSNDIEGEIAHCKLYKQILTTNLDGAKTEYNTKGKLYKSMSVLTAVALTIILI